MPSPVRSVLTALLPAAAAVAALVGCQTVPGLGEPPAGDVAFEVGDNGIGEPCRVRGAAREPDVPEARAVYDVFCGEWETPSARVYRTAAAGGGVAELATGGAWRERLASFAGCGPTVETTVLDGVPAAALDCRLRGGRWPYQAVVAVIGDEAYLADSIPAAYAATQTAIGVLAGLEPARATEATARSREMDRVAGRLDAARYSAGDLQQYRDALLLAQYYNFQGVYPEAEKQYRKALELQTRVMPSETGGLAFLHMHVALELSNQERFDAADALFDRAAQLLPLSLDPTDGPRLDSYRAIHSANRHDYRRAAELARAATAQREELAAKYRDHDAFVDLSPTFTSVELIVDAERYVYAGTGSRGQTDATLGDATQSRTETAYGDLVQSRSVEAALLIRNGELDEAERALDEALAILKAEPRVPRRWAPQIQFLRARIAELRGDTPAAERLLLDAVDGQRGLYVRSRGEGLILLALGRVLAAQGRPAEALDAFRAGVAIIGERGGGLRFADAAPYFRTALAEAERDPARRPALSAEMLEAGQLVRGPVTARTIALTAARLASGEQDVARAVRELQDAWRRRDELNERRTLAQADPFARMLPTEMDALEAEWREINAAVAELERRVQAAQPRYNQLVDRPATAEAVRGALGPGEAVAQILLGPTDSIGFVVDAEGVQAYEIDLGEAEARAIVADLRVALERGPPRPFDVEKAHALYRRLFGPVDARLARAEHVVTVPTGPLLSLPFGVLVVEPPPAALASAGDAEAAGLYADEVAWMARRHALTLAPSLRSLLNLRETARPSRATEPFIGFGDFQPHGDAEEVVATFDLPPSCRDDEDVGALASLAALPNTAREIRAIASGLGAPESPVVLGTAFSEETVKTTDLADYRILYFATHGLLPHELNCLPEPALVTSRPPGSAAPSDGLLTASEIMELDLDADLVVLSACNTGGPGGDTGGESLSGLARASFYAGARSLLVTHWSIPDEPTVALMIGTFSRPGLGVAEALRASQAELIRDPRWSHPFNWGAFTLVGDGARSLTSPPQAVAAAAE